MPTQWTLTLAKPANLDQAPWFDILHAIGCQFFEQPSTSHDADQKPFTTRPIGPANALTGLTLNWLPDQRPPTAAMPEELRLGAITVPVAEINMQRTAITDIATKTTGRRTTFTFTTPTHIRHHGTTYLLPDPYLVYTGLGRRLHTLHPTTTTDEQLRDLARTVVIYDHNIHTEKFTWHGNPSAGFLGTTTFGIPATAPTQTRTLFHTLNGLAAIAGIGHGTTHGFGAVTTTTEYPRHQDK